jgi:hypothetical protein
MVRKYVWFVLGLMVLQSAAYARGDKIIPQIADGSSIRTKIDLINVSSTVTITNYRIRFFHQDGTPWSLLTNLLSFPASEFPLTIIPRQTLRIETAMLSSSTTSGYAILRDTATKNSEYATDYVLGISVYYEVYVNGKVVDTVSVPVVSPTGLGSFPTEINLANGIWTGFAIVNLAGAANQVSMSLFSQDSTFAGSARFTLKSGEQRSEFLHQFLFQNLTTFKGLVEFKADGPVAFLALLQTRTPNGDQYATLVATDREALRTNSYVFLPQATLAATGSPLTSMPLDADNFIVDYFGNGDEDESYPWDIVYEGVSKISRRLKPVNGASLAILGIRNDMDFDSLSITDLKALTYSGNNIDLSDQSAGLNLNFAFAARTELGNYAKLRITRIINSFDTTGTPYKDLVLEIFLYR